jgi:WD40 repeat protein
MAVIHPWHRPLPKVSISAELAFALLAALVISLTATTVLAVRAGQQVVFSPGGKLAIGGVGGTVRLWNPAIGGAGGTVRLWNPATGRRAYVPLQTGPGPVEVVFSPSGKLLAGGDGTVRP